MATQTSVPTLSRRQLVRTGTLSAGVLLVGALFVILNYLGWKYHHRFDWTAGGVYTLSEKSRNVVEELKRDVEFVVFIAPGQDLYEPVREILSQYDAASQRIQVRYFDPERNPVEAQQLIQRVRQAQRREVDKGIGAGACTQSRCVVLVGKMDQSHGGSKSKIREGIKPPVAAARGW